MSPCFNREMASASSIDRPCARCPVEALAGIIQNGFKRFGGVCTIGELRSPQEAQLSERVEIDPTVIAYYDHGDEHDRLTPGGGTLEFLRTKELLTRFLPPPPASVLDVGGATGVYASW